MMNMIEYSSKKRADAYLSTIDFNIIMNIVVSFIKYQETMNIWTTAMHSQS